MSLSRPVAFSGNPLDRADALRQDAAQLETLRASHSRLLLMAGIEPLLSDTGALQWSEGAEGDELIFLGLDEAGAGCFAPVPSPEAASVAPAPSTLWQVASGMAAGDLALFGTVRAVAGWHARHRFCARCGAPTVLAKGGWQRNCTRPECRAEHFPRTDPVVIMTVEHEGRLLLGRSPRFPAGRYTALAGFVEPGETMEEAVAREIWEEAGVRVRDVRYVASQPWPYPSSLMLAAHGFADSPALAIDTAELEDARWFTRAEVAEAMEARARGEDGKVFNAPMPTAIAWHLLDHWLRTQG